MFDNANTVLIGTKQKGSVGPSKELSIELLDDRIIGKDKW